MSLKKTKQPTEAQININNSLTRKQTMFYKKINFGLRYLQTVLKVLFNFILFIFLNNKLSVLTSKSLTMLLFIQFNSIQFIKNKRAIHEATYIACNTYALCISIVLNSYAYTR